MNPNFMYADVECIYPNFQNGVTFHQRLVSQIHFTSNEFNFVDYYVVLFI